MRWSLKDKTMSAQELSDAKITIRSKPVWHSTEVYCLAFDKSGKFVFTGGDDGVVRVYSVTADELVKCLPDDTSNQYAEAVAEFKRTAETKPEADTELDRNLEQFAINDMTINDQNTLIAAAKHSGSILVWNLQTLELIIKFEEQIFPIRTIRFSSAIFDDKKYLISTSEDGFIFFYSYDYKTLKFEPKSVHRKGKYDGERAVNIAVDTTYGGYLFGLIYTFGVKTEAEVSKPKSKKAPFSKTPVQSAIRICSLSDELGLREEWKAIHPKNHSDCVYSLKFSNNSFRFANACDSDCNILIWNFDKGNKKWDSIIININAKSGAKKLLRGKSKQPSEDSVFVDELAFTIDDKYLITVLTDFTIKVWNSESGELVNHFVGYHSKKISVIEIHPLYGHIFMSAGYDSKIFIYDILKGSVIRHFDCSLDGTQAFKSASDDKQTSDSHIIFQLLQCSFSPDGNTIAATDDHGNLTIFSIESHKETDACDQLEEMLEKMHSEDEITKDKIKIDLEIKPSVEHSDLMRRVLDYETDLLKGIDKSSPLKSNLMREKFKTPKRTSKMNLDSPLVSTPSVPKPPPLSTPSSLPTPSAPTLPTPSPVMKARKSFPKPNLNVNQTKKKTSVEKSNEAEVNTSVRDIKEDINETNSKPEEKSPECEKLNESAKKETNKRKIQPKDTKLILKKIMEEMFENPNSLPFQVNDEIQFPTYRKEISDADLCLTSIREEMLANKWYTLVRFNKDVNKVLENAKFFYQYIDEEIFEMALTLEKFYCEKMETHFGDLFKAPLKTELSMSDDESGEVSKPKPKPSMNLGLSDEAIDKAIEKSITKTKQFEKQEKAKNKRHSEIKTNSTPGKRIKTSAKKSSDSDNKEIISESQTEAMDSEPSIAEEPKQTVMSVKESAELTTNGNNGCESCDKTEDLNDLIFCIFCEQMFSSKSDAKTHYIMHLCPLKCSKCSKSLATYDQYLSHECVPSDHLKGPESLDWPRNYSDSIAWIDKFLKYQETDDIESFEPITGRIRNCVVCEKVEIRDRLKTKNIIKEIKSIAYESHLEKHMKYVSQYQCLLCFLNNDNYFYCKTKAEASKHLTAEHENYVRSDGNPLQYFDGSIPKLDQIFNSFYN